MTMQESGPTSERRAASRRLVKASVLLAILLAVVLVSSLLMTVAALAQQSTSYDLACWSVTASGGGGRTSANFRLSDALGQNVSGTSTSASFEVRAGTVQNLAFLAPAPAPVITPVPPPSGTLTINLPIISSYITIKRTCPQ